MAKSSHKLAARGADPAEALANMEMPTFKWKVMAQIGGAFAILYITGFMLVPYVGYWAVGVIGVLNLVALGFGVYVYRLTSRSRAIVDIMKGATDESGRARAIEQLADDGGKDVMKVIARAQLLAQQDPQEAQRILEEVDVKKAPTVVQDDVRSQLAMLYLRNNRVKDARLLADDMRLDKQPNAKAKALYAAVMAECFARTGSAPEAKKLMETYDAADESYAEVRTMLLRAQVYTFFALKKNGLVRQAMETLAVVEPNMLASFVQKGTQPEMAKIAKQVLAKAGFAPKMKVQRSP